MTDDAVGWCEGNGKVGEGDKQEEAWSETMSQKAGTERLHGAEDEAEDDGESRKRIGLGVTTRLKGRGRS